MLAAAAVGVSSLLVYGPRIVRGIGATVRAAKNEERATDAEELPPAEYQREKSAHKAADASAYVAKKRP